MKGLNALRPLSSKIVNNIIGGKRHGGKNDWDFDGVPNRKDCQPRNTMRQDKTKIKIGDNLKFKDELGGINYGVVVGLYPNTSNPYEVKDTFGNIVRVYGPFVIGKA